MRRIILRSAVSIAALVVFAAGLFLLWNHQMEVGVQALKGQ